MPEIFGYGVKDLKLSFIFMLAESVLGGLQRRHLTISGFLTFHFSDWD